jgi:hypothetical protein
MAGKADIVNGIVDLTAVFQPVEDEEEAGSTLQSTPTVTDDKYSSKPGG